MESTCIETPVDNSTFCSTRVLVARLCSRTCCNRDRDDVQVTRDSRKALAFVAHQQQPTLHHLNTANVLERCRGRIGTDSRAILIVYAVPFEGGYCRYQSDWCGCDSFGQSGMAATVNPIAKLYQGWMESFVLGMKYVLIQLLVRTTSHQKFNRLLLNAKSLPSHTQRITAPQSLRISKSTM
jgi:hypothetical protein